MSNTYPGYELKDSLLDKCFSNAFDNVLYTMTGMKIEAVSMNIEARIQYAQDITGIMLLTGETSLLSCITMSADTANTLVSYITGSDASDNAREDLFDGLAELINMISGNAKALLAEEGYKFKLTSPLSIYGQNQLITHKNNVLRLIKNYSFEEHEITLRVYLL